MQWYIRGIEVLSQDGVTWLIDSSHRTRRKDDLIEEVQTDIEAAIEDGEPHDQASIDVMWAWLNQDLLVLWLRVRRLRDEMVQLLEDDLLALVGGAGCDFDDVASDLWEQLVRDWYDDWKEGKLDRILT